LSSSFAHTRSLLRSLLSPRSLPHSQVVSEHKSLHTLNLNFNRLCPDACAALLQGVCDPSDPLKPHPRLRAVVVDAALVGVPPEVYDRLGGPYGASGKKGGKKGKKKK
jgi:hypothetical protein